MKHTQATNEGPRRWSPAVFVEALTRLGDDRHKLVEAHARQSEGSAAKQALAHRLDELDARFERITAHWLASELDERERLAWATYFYEGGRPPRSSAGAPPPLFEGVTESGAQVMVYPRADGRVELVVGGSVERTLPGPFSLSTATSERVRLDEHVCREVFRSTPEALSALALFRDQASDEPPWRFARELYSDGLVDPQFGITDRGLRALREEAKPPSPEEAVFGVLAADGARARLFVMGGPHTTRSPTASPLVEVFRAVRPELRARDWESHEGERPSMRHEGAGAGSHTITNRGERRREVELERFASQVALEAVRSWRTERVVRAIVVASPPMLGLLRPALEHADHGPRPWAMVELDRDLSQLTPPALHDALAAEGLLPPRGRLAPLVPAPGQPAPTEPGEVRRAPPLPPRRDRHL